MPKTMVRAEVVVTAVLSEYQADEKTLETIKTEMGKSILDKVKRALKDGNDDTQLSIDAVRCDVTSVTHE